MACTVLQCWPAWREVSGERAKEGQGGKGDSSTHSSVQVASLSTQPDAAFAMLYGIFARLAQTFSLNLTRDEKTTRVAKD